MSILAPAKNPPSASEVEALAKEYRELEGKIADIHKKAVEETKPLITRLDSLWEILVNQVREYGSAHAAKSKKLYGLEYEVMCTFGSSSSIDGAAVETFRLRLKKAGQTRLLRKIFDATTRWTLKEEASKIILAAHEAGKLPAKLFVLFSQCTVTKDSTPRLEVRPKQQAQSA